MLSVSGVSQTNFAAQGRNGSIMPVASTSRTPQASAVDIAISKHVKENFDELLSAFKVYDIENNGSVTKGELRRIIEINITAINTADFGKVLKNATVNRNGSVQYMTFLKFYKDLGQGASKEAEGEKRKQADATGLNGKKPIDPNLNAGEIEKLLKNAIESNLSSVLRGFRLFDYNRDRKIQFHELRKILEQYCFPMSNVQFEKLWNSIDYSKMGLIDYMDFLGRLGVAVPNAGSKNVGQRTERKKLQLGSSGMNMDQLEVEYRRRLKEQHGLLKKACLVVDSKHSGLMPIKNFKAILDEFVIAVSDQEFSKLMERFSVKASHDIQWYGFLQKFVDPQSLSNGQTLPIRPSHKANVVRGSHVEASVQDLIQLLYNHILSAYSSLRNAFLQIDINRKGKITIADFRRLVQGFKFELSEVQIKEIMVQLDPEHTGFITYQKFLDIFEEKESADGHKWLVSTHKYNKDTKPPILAWKTVEDLLHQKIVLRWKSFTAALKHYDSTGTGYINPTNLKKVLDKIAIPLSDEHYDSLLKRLSHKTADGKVNYLEFLAVMQIDVYPGDVEGVSAQIASGNEARLQMRQSQHEKAMADIETHASLRTNMMSLEEIIVRLRDRSSQTRQHIRDAFLQMDDARKGFVSKAKFRLFLESHGIFLSDENFSQLTRELEFGREGLDYMRFVKHFEGRDSELNPSYLPMQNHKYNPVRGDEFGMSAPAVENKLRSKIRENFTTLREAFHKMDSDGRGYLTKQDFRRLLDQLMCLTNDAEFNKLCNKLGIDDDCKLSYRDFLGKFQEKDDLATGHKWLVSNHRYNELGDIKPKTAAEVHQLMAEKVHQNYKDIARAFCHIDYLGRGYITKREFKELLVRLNVTMDQEEFKKLWAYYDTANRNAITHDAFLKRVGVASAFSSGDGQGTSAKIIQNSAEYIAVHLEGQENRQENLVFNQAVLTVGLDADALFIILQKRIRDFFPTTYAAFRALDGKEKGYLSQEDFRIAVHQMHLFVRDESFAELMRRIGLSQPTAQMTYEAFCLAFDEKFSDAQFKEVVKGLLSQGDQVDYYRFLANFSQTQEAAERREWMEAANGGGGGAGGSAEDGESLSQQEVEARVSEFVSARPHLLAQAFAEADYAQLGVLAKTDFRDILFRLVMRMSNEQFDQLMTRVPTNEYGNVDYKEFLSRFASAEQPQQQQQQPTRPDSPISLTPPASADQAQQQQQQPQQPTLSLETEAEAQLRRAMSQSWKTLFSRFKLLDQATPDKPKQIHVDDFCAVLRSSGAVDLAPSQVAPILRRFGLRGDGYFRYQDCMRAFVSGDGPSSFGIGARASARGGPETAQIVRRKMERARISFVAPTAASAAPAAEPPATVRSGGGVGGGGGGMLTLAMRLRRRVLEDWKEMRRVFREQDPDGRGRAPPSVFRRVLRRFGLTLSDDEFYQLAAAYDPERSGSVDYNEFIRSFLRSA
uniref:EF-hand calcium-binding domain-containing protein 6 n=1 Tax=Macrostomum lignano TaxID=282301 RepID=A0A1I8JDN8_9PLAT